MLKLLAVPAVVLGCAELGLAASCSEDPAACPASYEAGGGEDESTLMQLRGKSNLQAGARPRQGALGSSPYLGNAKQSTGGVSGGGENLGKIKINEDGVINEYWLPGANTIDNSTAVAYKPPYRFYLMKTDTTDYSNVDNFYQPNYIGKTFSVDFDFGGANGAGCGCNLNFYLVDMPSKTGIGADGDYYCDAQCFDNLGCCSEFDMNEGNMMTQQITNHACTNDYKAHTDWECHKWGDPEVKTTPQEFSPGTGSTIDSTKKFTYEQEFKEEDGEAIFITRMIQGDKKVVKTMGPGNSQLNAMFQVIKEGMVFVTGYWSAPDMNWLDGEECGNSPETCSNKPAYIGNWKLTTNTPGPEPDPQPTPRAATTTPTPDGLPSLCCWDSCGEGCGDGMGDWCNANSEQCSHCGGGVWCR